MQKLRKTLRIDLGHVRESLTPLLDVRTDKRVHPHEIDVIADDHKVARTERRIDSARGVREEECLATHPPQDLDRQHDRFPSRALVVMAASAPCGDQLARMTVKNELAAMTLHRGRPESGDVRVLDAHQDLVDLQGLAPAAPQQDAEIRRILKALIRKIASCLIKEL